MPTYEFRCRTCETTFALKRTMAESSDPAPCPEGHGDTVKLLSQFAATRATGGGPSPAPMPAMSGGGGCCGGACGC